MSVIHIIAAQRQKLLDGLDANEGDINLRIFEDFYPDEAHFIYELLQNAEDAGATEVAFELFPHSCAFEHNGTRHFDERDIRGITGIFNSSKAHDPDKIGKFGVGFKSVFVYTDTPIVYSQDFSFKILKLVLPQEVPQKPELGGNTRFEFPFNNPKKNAKDAYAEVKAGLEQLSETTLLFLNNLRYIRWTVGGQKGEVLREQHSESHVEVLRLLDSKEVFSSHWLRFSAPVEHLHRFTAPVEDVERQRVAVAYELSFIGDTKSFDAKRPLAKQFKISPAVRGKVAVFFPADKETSGLRFHLHAPFVPELSRASIKNSPENVPLFEQLAAVAAKSLHEIKLLGLLTGEFLAVLPNNSDVLPERYKIIRSEVIAEMKTRALVPTNLGGHAAGHSLIQARAAMKALLSDEDLAFVTGRMDSPTWAIGATQKNSLQDRFLDSLELPYWDADSLRDFFEARARKDSRGFFDIDIDPKVIEWLSSKPLEWHQALYATLGKFCEDESDYGELDETCIVRMANGTYRVPRGAYFQTGPLSLQDPLPRVDEEVLTCGTRKTQQAEARKFLMNIGVKVPGEWEEIGLLLRTRYGSPGGAPSEKIYLEDLKRLIEFIEKNPQARTLIGAACFFRIDSPEFGWGKASDVYLDSPYLPTGLAHFYASAKKQSECRWPLDPWYLSCGIPAEKIARFAALCGCESEFKGLFVQCQCNGNPKKSYLYQAPGQRAGNYIDRDYAITAQALRMLQSKQIAASLLVWSAMRRAGASVLRARFQWNDRGGSHFADSQLICTLKDLEWVPLSDGSFVRPREATQRLLHKGFAVDTGDTWLERVEFGAEERRRATETTARAKQRAEFGFSTEEALQRALAFARLPEAEQERFLANAHKPEEDEFELPERSVRNAEQRAERVSEQAKQTPDKTSVVIQRSVQLGTEAAKTEAKIYLADQYTNTNGQMICQVCKGALPFKLPNGSYYFEAVELIPNLPKRFRETYLSLCPNHAAAYQYANAQRDSLQELVLTANDSEIEIVLGGVEATIYFTQMHLADAKACLEAEEEDVL
ncbi:hypothetical protein GPA27_16370 [Aromatoleum toluolicum]|uniref:Sacsin/Nov domain-containing protein n=1 Tax=Aromatoleum toluolicum TaxID=90060 RepID=A0ABX1NI54_9RHOO|nr:hypothetical protein [Aromatoleum toluolicum]NMF98955.1 hypothetical protein [Aromatoleum toluolicum]